ncbi:hypothetical protein [Hoeflea sp.]|jgi:hypothetical protein|uniref:hypothetical protein n=1 Tax=Hoeflea sp. TaxID=1940281 RepID=UPI003A91967C
MIPEDDFLLIKPARRESVTALRIALMAAMGCLLLLSALVIQARAEPDAMLNRQINAGHQIEQQQTSVNKPAGQTICSRPQHPAC